MGMLEEGMSVICPNDKCKYLVAIVSDPVSTDRIVGDDLLDCSDVTKEEEAKIKQFCCPKCGEKYIRLNGTVSVHTNVGWV